MKPETGNLQRNSRAEHTRLVALVLVALVALVAGVLLVVSIVRLPEPQARRARVDTAASLNLARHHAGQRDRIPGEEALLFDPTPLFLPTRYNSSQIDDAAGARREPGESLLSFEPRFVYSASTFAITFPDPLPGPAQPAEVLLHGRTQTPHAQFGRMDHDEKPFTARLAQVEVVQMKTGRVLLTLTIERDPGSASGALPAALAAGDWNPMELGPLEFVVTLDDAGLAGAPVLAPGTTPGTAQPAAEVREFFARQIVQTLRIGQRRDLGAGTYIVRIGP